MFLPEIYANDTDFTSHTEENIQAIIDLFSSACIALRLTINLIKTKVVYTPFSILFYTESSIVIQGI